jgi:Ca2+-binding EF-hand superfamily protein
MTQLYKIGILFLVSLLLVCMNAFAQQTNEVETNEVVIDEGFRNMDSDNSRDVSRQEMQAYQQKRFSELDEKKNGVLDAEELKGDSGKIFEKASRNSSGTVNRGQAEKQLKKDFDEMDSNQDSRVDAREYREYLPQEFGQ